MDVDVASGYDDQLRCGDHSPWNKSTIGIDCGCMLI